MKNFSKKFKKITALLLTVVTVIAFTACSGDNGRGNNYEEQIDAKKTNIYVANFDGGLGKVWLQNAIKRFESQNAEVSYETDKKGVHVIIDDSLDKEQVKGTSLIDIIADNRAHLFFTEQVYYKEFVREGLIADITDVVKKTNTDGKTIESKLTREQRDYLNYGGKYYMVPFYAGFTGIMYDIDLFVAENLYFGADEDSIDEEGFIVNKRATKANGPDGVAGTPDDGLPATYDEFFKLCTRMIEKDIIPFIWSGEYMDPYTKEFLVALQADYEGLDQMMLNYTLNGRATDIVTDIVGNGLDAQLTTEEVDITTDNGYRILQQAGKYYALAFFEKMLTMTVSGKKLYSSKSVNTSYSHTDAQDEFLLSRPEGKPIAMLLDGVWWENEASDSNTFADAAEIYGNQYSREQRNLGVMYLPKANNDKFGANTVVDSKFSAAFINAAIKNASEKKAAEDFLAFCYTDDSLVKFTQTTNVCMSLEYELTDSDLEKLSPFGRNAYIYRKNANKVFAYSGSDFFGIYAPKLKTEYLFGTKTNKGSFNVPVTTFKNNTISAAEYFLGIASYYSKDYWSTNYEYNA